MRQRPDLCGREGRRRGRDRRLVALQSVVVERLGEIADFVVRVVGRTEIVLAEVGLAERPPALFVGQRRKRRPDPSVR